MTTDRIQQRIMFLLTDVHDAARAGDWPGVKAKAEEVLRLNPFNHDARAYWTLAKNGGAPFEDNLDTRIAKQLDGVKIAAAVEDWQEVIDESQKVLDIDPQNSEAQRYIRAALEALAPKPKKGLFNRQKAPTPVAPLVSPSTISTRPPAPAPVAAEEVALAAVNARPPIDITSPKYLYVDNNFISNTLSGAIAIMALLYLLAGAFYYYGAGIVSNVDRGESPASDASSFDSIATIVATALVLGFIACFVLFVFWLFREVTNARAMGMKTLLEPSVSLIVAVALGTLGTYVVLRDLLAKLRDGFSPLGEGIMVAWLLCAIGGLALNLNSMKHPADHGEWAALLHLAAYGSFLLAAAGLALAFSIRDGHEHLLNRYLRPKRAPKAESTANSVAA